MAKALTARSSSMSSGPSFEDLYSAPDHDFRNTHGVAAHISPEQLSEVLRALEAFRNVPEPVPVRAKPKARFVDPPKPEATESAKLESIRKRMNDRAWVKSYFAEGVLDRKADESGLIRVIQPGRAPVVCEPRPEKLLNLADFPAPKPLYGAAQDAKVKEHLRKDVEVLTKLLASTQKRLDEMS